MKIVQVECGDYGEIGSKKLFDIASISPDGRYFCIYFMENKYADDPIVEIYFYNIESLLKGRSHKKWKSFISESAKNLAV